MWNAGQHIGDRDQQEDSCAVRDGLAIVCDGLGGHAGGEVASKAAVDAFLVQWELVADALAQERLWSALEAANEAVGEAEKRRSGCTPIWGSDGMGTTLLAVYVVPAVGRMWYISVGDSPLFLVRGDSTQMLNTMHNTPGSRNSLSSALIGGEIALIDESPDDGMLVHNGDVLVAASDGIETLDPDEIRAVVSGAGDPADALVAEVLDRKAARQDNVTVAVWR